MADQDAKLQILISYIRDEMEAKNALMDLEALEKGTKKAGEGAHEAGEGVGYFNVHGREMHRLIHELDRMLPGTGLILRAVFNPTTLGIAGVVLALELIKKGVEGYTKSLEAAHAAAVKADFAAGMEAALEATRSATDAQETYLRNLEEIKRGEHGVAAEMNNELQLLAAIKAARQGQAEAEKTLALAKLKEDEVTGRLTESDAIIRKGEIEKKFVENKARSENQAFVDQQRTRLHALDEAAAKEAALEQAHDEAARKLSAAKLAQASAKSAPTVEEVRKAQEEADKAAEHLKSFYGFGLNEEIPRGKGLGEDIRAQEAAREAQRKADSMQRQHNQQDQANKDLTALEEDEKRKAKAVDENAKALAAARDDVAKAAAIHDKTALPADMQTRAQEGAIDAQTRTELKQRALELQKRQVQGETLTQQDAMELLAAIRGLGEAFFEQGKDKVTRAQMKTELEKLKRLIEGKGK